MSSAKSKLTLGKTAIKSDQTNEAIAKHLLKIIINYSGFSPPRET